MAVGRIKGDRRWFEYAASLATEKRMRRELARAADHSRETKLQVIAELDGDEVRELARLMPDEERVQVALQEVEYAEEGDRIKRARMQERLRARHRIVAEREARVILGRNTTT